MKVKVILNPYANRWRAGSQAPAVQAALAAAGVACDLVVTEAAGQGTREAVAAVEQGYDAVVAAGGDSTVNEVVNGLVAAAGDGPTHPLGVLPLGTGNDFNDMSGLPRNLDECARVIAGGKTRPVDVGVVTFTPDGRQPLRHYFDNNCALAMEPMVTIENVKMTWLKGNIRYIAALAKALLRLKAWHMTIEWDGGRYEGPTYLLSVCNSPRTGGLFHMAPDAKMDDGLLDFVFAPEIPKTQVLAILPRLFKGTHIHHPAITSGRTRRLSIQSRPGTPIHADGEVLTAAAGRVEYEVLAGKLTLIVP